MSQVPAFILAINSTFPLTISTCHIKPAVDAFKSGEDTSVKTAEDESQVAKTCPILFAPPCSVIQYSKKAAHPKSGVNESTVTVSD
jgi:hypothetical protein